MEKQWLAAVEEILESCRGHIPNEEPTGVLADLRVWFGSSASEPEAMSIAAALRTVVEKHGATVFPRAGSTSKIDDVHVAGELKGADLIAMLAVTPGVSAEAMHVCHIADTNADKMVVYMPSAYRDGFIFDVLSRRYRTTITPFDLMKTAANGDPALCRRFFMDALGAVERKRMKQKLEVKHAPTLAIVTALPLEMKAASAILRGSRRQMFPASGPSTEYVHGTISSQHGGEHQVVVALAGKGNNKAAIRANQLINDFTSIEVIFMVGIAAGVPNLSKASEHVRLGDIVVSDGAGVIQYDMIKQKSGKIVYDASPRPPSAVWTNRLEHYMAETDGVRTYWSYIDEMCGSLNVKRPSKGPLNDSDWNIAPSARHPSDPKRTKNRPRLFSGAIGSANTLLKSEKKRNKLRDDLRVKAIEMEGSGIADAAWEHQKGYVIVRGICDYANDAKNDLWQEYAAIAAAAFARELIESMPVTVSARE